MYIVTIPLNHTHFMSTIHDKELSHQLEEFTAKKTQKQGNLVKI